MEVSEKAELLIRFLREAGSGLSPKGRTFLTQLLESPGLLTTMELALPEHRRSLRLSIVISTRGGLFSPLLDRGAPEGGGLLRRLHEQMALTVPEVLQSLGTAPIWFLCLDPPPPEARSFTEALGLQQTVTGLAAVPRRWVRWQVLVDQVDGALAEGDRPAFQRLSDLLRAEFPAQANTGNAGDA